MGIPFSQGVQYVLDTQMKFVRAGLPCYLRVANFTAAEEGAAAEVGVAFSPSGTVDTGFTDVLIDPPPYVNDVSLRDIGIFGGRLEFGSRIFVISNTFVMAQLQLKSFVDANVTDPYAVFRDRDGYSCIGIYYNNRLFDITSITHKEVAGQTISWKIIGNAEEQATTVSGGP
jgi:hypothetical protein